MEVEFKKVREYMKKNGLSLMEKEVYLGVEEKLKTRLVIYLLPEEEVEKRIRKANINNKKKGRNALTKDYIARAHLNLFITNTSAEVVPSVNVWDLYRMRWQIELTFKIWKSICNIEKVKKVKKERLECYIFSRLIFIVLGWKIVWNTAKRLFCRKRKALSFYKSFKTLLKVKIREMRVVFLMGKGRMEDFMDDFYSISERNHLLEKKKGKPTSLDILLGCSNG